MYQIAVCVDYLAVVVKRLRRGEEPMDCCRARSDGAKADLGYAEQAATAVGTVYKGTRCVGREAGLHCTPAKVAGVGSVANLVLQVGVEGGRILGNGVGDHASGDHRGGLNVLQDAGTEKHIA